MVITRRTRNAFTGNRTWVRIPPSPPKGALKGEMGNMDFNRETVDKIAKNAKTARDVWDNFAHDEKLHECFHLRPTSSGIAVISTLSYAPMRGILVKPNMLKNKLDEIAKSTDVLLGVDEEKSKILMEKWGFNSRKSEAFREENAQALFIQGMILKQEMYEGIDFVASELVLAGKSSRFDIIGYKDGTLYIFEMKKDRELAGLNQTAEYEKLVNENKALYLDVLKNYPHCHVADFKKVNAIAVMRYASNSAARLAKMANEAGVGLWFYERSITLRKA